MAKRRDVQKRIGRKGEDVFQVFADDHRLLPTVPREDYGFDFLCHVEQSGIRTREISGDFVGVSVRSTSGHAQRVRLSRDDAETYLRAKFVVCFVLVAVETSASRVFHRFVDEAFAIKLSQFLSSERKYMTLRTRDCGTESEFDGNLDMAIRGNFPERVRLAVAHHNLSGRLLEPRLEVRRTSEDEYTIVAVEDFYSYFVKDNIPRQDETYAAIFGSPRLRLERLAQIGPLPEVEKELALLPSPVLIGRTAEYSFNLIAENSRGRDTLTLQRVDTKTYTGWVYEAGFSITISARKNHAGRWIHEIDALIDQGEELDLESHADLWRFLERCTDDAVVFPELEPKMRLETSYISGLRGAEFFARCLRSASRLPGWEHVRAPLRMATDSEVLHTIALLAEAETRPDFLQGFGFLVEHVGETASVASLKSLDGRLC